MTTFPCCKDMLDSLPDKRKPTLKNFVTEHLEYINEAIQNRGYSYNELAAEFKDKKGVKISEKTLAKYTQQLNRKATKARAPKMNLLSLPTPR